MRGDGRVYQRDAWLWVCYYKDGKQIREAAKGKDGRNTNDPKVAAKFLKSKVDAITTENGGGPAFLSPAMRRITVGEMLEALKTGLKLEDKLSVQTASHIKRAIADFGEFRATALTSEEVDSYIEGRLAEGDRPATVNRVTQLIKQAYKLAIERKRLSQAPSIRHLSEKGNARQGFFTEQEFHAVCAHLPTDLRDFAEYCWLTGSRKGEAASLTWQMLEGHKLRIPPTVTKNKQWHVLPLGPQLAEVIARRQTARRIEQDGTVRMAEFIFHRDGEPIYEFRKSWATACKKAGLAGKLFHDLRRSCARRLLAAGVSQQAAKKITGHASDSMFERYAILIDDDVLAAQQKAADYREPEQKVVAMR